ncbi:hypothetical protein [Streptomyces sp. NPDC058671]|uniref:hypothetical protein n=1 Tax=Streptomyces sp. NPDC058671 TaxID=3346590 RepID=UPI0036653BF6
MNRSSIAHTLPRLTGNCPSCNGPFEACRCGARPTVPTGLSVRAGTVDDIEREDDAKGYEPENALRLHRLVRHLVADSDHRAQQAGRQSRRTLDQMVPERQRREFLSLVGPARVADDVCPMCEHWQCRCNNSLAPAFAGAGSVRGE